MESDNENRNAVLSRLREKVSGMPDAPGVYMFKDSAGIVLYVGNITFF